MKAPAEAVRRRTSSGGSGSGERALDPYQQLRNEIVSGRFHPNERLVEADLSHMLGAGRNAIRAALVRLD